MKISNLGLAAFFKTAQRLNITHAAEELGLTQSALSQRIKLLEEDLEVTLFVREPRGLKLTEAGEKLLRYCDFTQALEEELLQEYKGSHGELAGTLRIGAYSSVMRSVVIPTLAPFLRKHPKVNIDFQSYEMYELPDVLSTARAEMIVMDYALQKKGVAVSELGQEEFVVVEGTKHQSPANIYLDHGPQDNATEDFFRQQSRRPKSIRRSFMGDVYGIIDGVHAGLGRAVMSRHLIEDDKSIRILTGYSKYLRPVTLHYFEQVHYPRLFLKVREELEKNAGRHL